MAATLQDIKRWIKENQETHHKRYLIIMVDTYDHEDYPVYATKDFCLEKIKKPGDMQCIIEIYDFEMDLEFQLKERRAYHPPKSTL